MEVKDKRYRIHPNEDVTFRERTPLKTLRTHNQVELKHNKDEGQKFLKIKLKKQKLNRIRRRKSGKKMKN